MVFALRPNSGWTNTTVCWPGGVVLDFGVLPSGRPSKMTMESGFEVKVSVALAPLEADEPDDDDEDEDEDDVRPLEAVEEDDEPRELPLELPPETTGGSDDPGRRSMTKVFSA
jgi:hypothetical protein